MSFGLWWVISFAAPAALALRMPGVRSLALCILISAASITVGLQSVERSITEATDGPASAFAILLFWTGYAGLAAGASIRLLVLTIRACANARLMAD